MVSDAPLKFVRFLCSAFLLHIHKCDCFLVRREGITSFFPYLQASFINISVRYPFGRAAYACSPAVCLQLTLKDLAWQWYSISCLHRTSLTCLLGQLFFFSLCPSSPYSLQRSCVVTAGPPLFMSWWTRCQQAAGLHHWSACPFTTSGLPRA